MESFSKQPSKILEFKINKNVTDVHFTVNDRTSKLVIEDDIMIPLVIKILFMVEQSLICSGCI